MGRLQLASVLTLVLSTALGCFYVGTSTDPAPSCPNPDCPSDGGSYGGLDGGTYDEATGPDGPDALSISCCLSYVANCCSAPPDAVVLASPVFTPPPGITVAVGSSVAIVCADLPSNGQIFYTTDGTLPSDAIHSSLYAGPIPITHDLTIHAVCTDRMDGYGDSTVEAASYQVTTGDAGSASDTGDAQVSDGS